MINFSSTATGKTITCLFLSAFVLFKMNCLFAQTISAKWIDKNLKESVQQYKVLAKNVPEGVMPETFQNDSIKTCNSSSWIAGFYSGTLLYLYEATHDTALYNEALKKIVLMNNEQYNTDNTRFRLYDVLQLWKSLSGYS